MARPLGEISTAVIKRLKTDGPMPMAQLARHEKIHTQSLWAVLNRLTANGHIVVAKHKRVAWSKRPVAVYSIPTNPKQQAVLSLPWGNQFT